MSTEQAACMGCFVNPPMSWYANFLQDAGRIHLEEMSKSYAPNPGLTAQEKECLNHLVEAWNLFVGMDNKHPSDNPEFCKAIHDAQKMLALRVARRVDTDVWSQWPREHLPTDPIT
jgi:hypothetical protein